MIALFFENLRGMIKKSRRTRIAQLANKMAETKRAFFPPESAGKLTDISKFPKKVRTRKVTRN